MVDEGDMNGRLCNCTIFDIKACVVYILGNALDMMAIQVGHISSKKQEPARECVYASSNNIPYLFINSEHASLVFVYNISDNINPQFHQILPAGLLLERSSGNTC